MSKKQATRKKTVVVTKKKSQGKQEKLKPTVSRSRSSQKATREPLIFGRANYLWMIIGVVVIALGMLLMIGGSMPAPDVWEPERIYSFRRTVLAPFLIVVGFLIEVYAIFKTS